METTNYRGYCKDLPVKRGDKVSIPKGAMVRSMHPSRNPCPAGRGIKVTVHHTLCGVTMTIGHYYTETSQWFWAVREKDLYHAMEQRGLPYGTRDETEASMASLQKEAMNTLVDTYNQGKVLRAVLHLENPKVCWAGSGGYWCEADINDVVCR